MQDIKRLHLDLSEKILLASFDIMNELGTGFLESVYKNALFIELKQKGFKIESEKKYEVRFRERKIGLFIADLVIEESLIVELKCCERLIGVHQAQLINYLKASGILVGLLINFGKRKLEYKRVYHPDYSDDTISYIQKTQDQEDFS